MPCWPTSTVPSRATRRKWVGELVKSPGETAPYQGRSALFGSAGRLAPSGAARRPSRPWAAMQGSPPPPAPGLGRQSAAERNAQYSRLGIRRAEAVVPPPRRRPTPQEPSVRGAGRQRKGSCGQAEAPGPAALEKERAQPPSAPRGPRSSPWSTTGTSTRSPQEQGSRPAPMPQYPPVKGPIQRSLREQKARPLQKCRPRREWRAPAPEEGQRRKGEHGEGLGQSLKPEAPRKRHWRRPQGDSPGVAQPANPAQGEARSRKPAHEGLGPAASPRAERPGRPLAPRRSTAQRRRGPGGRGA